MHAEVEKNDTGARSFLSLALSLICDDGVKAVRSISIHRSSYNHTRTIYLTFQFLVISFSTQYMLILRNKGFLAHLCLII